MEAQGYQLAFWLVTAVFGIVVFIAGSMFKRWADRIDNNFNELFTMLKYLAKQTDLDCLEAEVKNLHDRVIRMEEKIKNCKSCNE
jgi:hypothetical protein